MKSYCLFLILSLPLHPMNHKEIFGNIIAHIDKIDTESLTDILNKNFCFFVSHPLYFEYDQTIENFLNEKRDNLISDIELNKSLAQTTQSLIELTKPQPNLDDLHTKYMKKLQELNQKNLKNLKQQLVCDNFLSILRIKYAQKQLMNSHA